MIVSAWTFSGCTGGASRGAGSGAFDGAGGGASCADALRLTIYILYRRPQGGEEIFGLAPLGVRFSPPSGAQGQIFTKIFTSRAARGENLQVDELV